ncbi:MAG: hypothetical protein E7300_04980 [Lachnospiraceae bacterium]|nr:hypothetical protein [Lachnospiraceae bacterium]
MKLISCHIENFGKLQNFDYDFHDGKNVICEENGWGKSTLVSFIRVMLFGFDREGRQSRIENERKRFVPWQRGVYGGTLTFEADGKRYRIVRTFDEKKAANDHFVLYDDATNLESDDFSSAVGPELFGIDAESFERTVYIGQQAVETDTTPDINAKIGNVSDETADMGRFKDAYDRLKKMSDQLTPSRATGRLKQLKGTIEQLKNSIRNKDAVVSAIEKQRADITQRRDRIASDREALKEVQERLTMLSSAKELLAEAKQYEMLWDDAGKASEAAKEARTFFPGEVPAPDAIGEAERALELARSGRQTAENFALNEEESEVLLRLTERFAGEIPEESFYADIRERMQELAALKEKKREAAFSASEEQRLADLEQQFGSYRPDPKEIDAVYDAWNTRTALKASLPPGSALPLAGGLVASAGAVLAILAFIVPSISEGGLPRILPFAGAGFLLLIAGAALFLQGLKREKARRETASKIISCEEEAGIFFAKTGCTYTEQDAALKLASMKERLRELNELEERRDAIRKERLDERITDMEDAIRRHLVRFGEDAPDGDYLRSAEKIRHDAENYTRLKERKERARKALESADASEREAARFIQSLQLDPSDDPRAQLSLIRERVTQLSIKSAEAKARMEAVMSYEKTHDVGRYRILDDTGEQNGSMEELNARFDELKDRIDLETEKERGLRDMLDQYLAEQDEIEEKEETLAACQEEYELLAHRYNVLTKTMHFLEMARTNFTARYMDPIKRSFDRYYGMIAGDECSCELDASLAIKVNEQGELREIGYLSEGSKDLVALCRRMAMVEAMYEKEKPFLIFDDPFVNLDDRKLIGAGKFLDALAADYQILYISCSKNRAC